MKFYAAAFAVVLSAGILAVQGSSPLDHCASVFDLEKLENAMVLTMDDRVQIICDLVRFLDCVDDTLEQLSGFKAKDLSSIMSASALGKAATLLVNMRNLSEEICSNNTRLGQAFRQMTEECTEGLSPDMKNRCLTASRSAYQSYSNPTATEMRYRLLFAPMHPFANKQKCLEMAYFMGCIGVEFHAKCGEESFDTQLEILSRSGILRTIVCTEHDLELAKTDFLESLDLSEDEKAVYERVINA